MEFAVRQVADTHVSFLFVAIGLTPHVTLVFAIVVIAPAFVHGPFTLAAAALADEAPATSDAAIRAAASARVENFLVGVFTDPPLVMHVVR